MVFCNLNQLYSVELWNKNNKMIFIYLPSVDIKSWDIQKSFIVYQTFALSQIVKLTIITLTSLSCKVKIINIQCFFCYLPVLTTKKLIL
jgi:hypothetical protein